MREKGQALLIVVLVMVVVLTVALSLASRSLTNLHNTTDEANSQAAFAAAEAGVEQALKLGTSGTVLQGVALNDKNDSQISSVSAQTIDGNEYLLNNGNPIFQDDGVDIWLSPFDTNQANLFQNPWSGTLNIYWGTTSDSCSEAAVEILVISGTRVSPTLSKYAFDSCRTRNNGFPDAPAKGSFEVVGINGDKTFNYKAPISVTNGLLVRVIPLYTAAIMGVKGVGNPVPPDNNPQPLPTQGKLITSTGVAGLSTQQVVRKVTFFQGYPSLPSEVFYSLFSPK